MSPDFMRRAIVLALENVRSGSGGPFAALIVKEGRILGEGTNRVTLTNDPTAHAEVVAIREACRVLADFQLSGCDLYTTCEPCPMCVGAIYWARPVNRADAHRARLARGIEIAAAELKISENAAGLANGHHFRMRGRIVRKRHAVRAFGKDAFFLDSQGSEGPAASRADIFQRHRDGALHEVGGHDLSFYRISDCTVRSKIATRHLFDAWNHLTPGPRARHASPPGLQENELAVGCSIALHGFAFILSSVGARTHDSNRKHFQPRS